MCSSRAERLWPLPWALLVLLGTACGQGVHSVTDLGDPLAVIEGRIEGELPTGVDPERLRASMIWETLPQELLDCLVRAEEPGEIFACASPSDFRPAHTSNSIPIQAAFPAAFDVPLHRLPDPAVLSGPAGERFGYGILVVYEDGDGDGQLGLVEPGERHSADQVLASSFEDGTRLIVYREGLLSPAWKLFAALACPEPENGFSEIRLAYDWDRGVICELAPIEQTTITLRFDDSESVRQLICEPAPVTSSYPAEPPPADREIICHHRNSLEYVLDPEAYCAHTRRYELAGCHDLTACTQPDWDLTARPPAWWPCDGRTDNGFSLSDAADELGPGPDELFHIRYDSGEKRYAMDEIQVWVFGPGQVVLIFTHPRAIRLEDRDGDSKLSPGDELVCFEPEGVNRFDQGHDLLLFDVNLVNGTDVLRAGVLAELVWTP
ncbi:MAG: hypothetical protein JXR96_28100 [Deltaproteobacteria bacterium]|nr:hypothetical protein [Deltaproteobacteria bacterium]